jgi:cellulose synthase/poly-beta-1,6-N-acetylglucosamine synthase-like glycosyltransferase
VSALVLNGGGLYRREALCEVGHMSDRNLHAFEEYDLGARLRQKGWRLLRMPDHAANHYGHQLSTAALMWLRVRSGTFASYGKLMRASYEKHYIFRLLRELRAIQLSLFTIAFWTFELLLSLFAPALALASSTVALISFVALMALKRRSLALGAFTVLTWHLSAAGLIVGLFKPRTPPEAEISYTKSNGAAGLAHPATACEPHASFDTSHQLRKPARPISVGPRIACADVSDS